MLMLSAHVVTRPSDQVVPVAALVDDQYNLECFTMVNLLEGLSDGERQKKKRREMCDHLRHSLSNTALYFPDNIRSELYLHSSSSTPLPTRHTKGSGSASRHDSSIEAQCQTYYRGALSSEC